MDTLTVNEIKKELVGQSNQELVKLCLRLAKFKKENKELLSYLLVHAEDENAYIESVKTEIDVQFQGINRQNYYYIKKSVRKILSHIRRCARYSQKKETEVELLIYFCSKLKHFTPAIQGNQVLVNIYKTQISKVQKLLQKLDEDLQYDHGKELEKLVQVG